MPTGGDRLRRPAEIPPWSHRPTRSKTDVLEQLTAEGLVPVIRAESAAIALRIVEALVEGASGPWRSR